MKLKKIQIYNIEKKDKRLAKHRKYKQKLYNYKLMKWLYTKKNKKTKILKI